MRLLVSVPNAQEACVALAAQADVIDAKDPAGGALGPVSLEVLKAILAAVNGERAVTAALGDATDEATTERAAFQYAAAGAALVKVGFGGIRDSHRLEGLAAAAARGAHAGSRGRGGVVAVGYVDADHASSPAREALLAASIRAGMRGVLLDTVNKRGPGLRDLLAAVNLADWVTRAHDAGLLVALAGKLRPEDLSFVRDAGADIAGVRGAACVGGRSGRVSAERVRRLRALCMPTIKDARRADPDATTPTGQP
jgi:uncharacterized protein (UPF0264 family)